MLIRVAAAAAAAATSGAASLPSAWAAGSWPVAAGGFVAEAAPVVVDWAADGAVSAGWVAVPAGSDPVGVAAVPAAAPGAAGVTPPVVAGGTARLVPSTDP